MKNSKICLASCVVYQQCLSQGEECNVLPAQCKGQQVLWQHRVAAELHQVTLHGNMPHRKGHTLGSNPACPAQKAGFCTRLWLPCSGKCLLRFISSAGAALLGCKQMLPEPPTAAGPRQGTSEQAQVVGKNKAVKREGSFLRKRRGTGHSGSGQLVQGASQTPDLHELK